MRTPIVVNRRLPVPLHRQIYDAWRGGILEGRFARGDRRRKRARTCEPVAEPAALRAIAPRQRAAGPERPGARLATRVELFRNEDCGALFEAEPDPAEA